MMLKSAGRLAWRLLWHDPARLATSLGGLAFAVFLMLIQMGFRNSLIDSATALLSSLDGEIFLMHESKDYSLERETIPWVRGAQALSIDGVIAAYPVWFAAEAWRNLENGTYRPIRMIGVRVTDPVFLPEDIRAGLARLGSPDAALLDSRSRRYYGNLGEGPAQVGRQGLNVVGNFAMAADLEVDGNLIVSDETYIRVKAASLDEVELIALKVRPGADLESVARRLREALPGDVAVRTREETMALDRGYWDTGTPVSMVVFIGMAMGFMVGVVICYQILYTEVADHLAEFATLRAIGFGKLYIMLVVLIEALLLSLVGLVPSLLAGWGMYRGLEAATGMLLNLTAERILFVSVVTVLMCVFAGILAVRKVLQADPAELF
jgi:putative ABC transport system permease protein